MSALQRMGLWKNAACIMALGRRSMKALNLTESHMGKAFKVGVCVWGGGTGAGEGDGVADTCSCPSLSCVRQQQPCECFPVAM